VDAGNPGGKEGQIGEEKKGWIHNC